jgi:L-lactate dehydrogenase complex protein LldE
VLKSTVKILERQGVQVAFPTDQTCSGQIYFNTGFQSQSRVAARQWLDLFTPTEGYIISPSGSCVDMVKHHYPQLFPDGTPEHQMAVGTAARTFELTQFLYFTRAQVALF